MEFQDVVQRRHMVRTFSSEPIGAIAIGHDAEPATRNLRSRRRPAAEVIHHGRW